MSKDQNTILSNLNNDLIDTASRCLLAGDLIGMPTETVYGLAADATNDQALEKIYATKKRPKRNPLIIHVLNEDHAREFVYVNDRAQKLMAAFWPGALTVVLQKTKTCPIPDLPSAGLNTLAVRCPAHPIARAVIEKTGRPIAAPSANISEAVSPTTADHVRGAFPGLLVLDGGPCQKGLESTIIDLSVELPCILRPGTITREDIEEVLSESIIGYVEKNSADAAISSINSQKLGPMKSPGLSKRHYAPSIPVRLNVTEIKDGEVLLSFGRHELNAAKELNLSESANLDEAASNLFFMLRSLDQKQYSGIAVMPIPNEGVGVAINDRLKRASC